MKTFIYNYWKSISWTILITILLFTSGDNLPKTHILKIPHLDKIVHFGMFAGLQFLILLEYRIAKGRLQRNTIILMTFLPAFYGIFTEIMQFYFISGRDGTWRDFVADIIGISAGLIFYVFYTRRAINQS